jgi:hypothetical protein
MECRMEKQKRSGRRIGTKELSRIEIRKRNRRKCGIKSRTESRKNKVE